MMAPVRHPSEEILQLMQIQLLHSGTLKMPVERAAGTGLYATMPQWVQEGGHTYRTSSVFDGSFPEGGLKRTLKNFYQGVGARLLRLESS